MRDIAIYGAGGLGREVACMIDYMIRIGSLDNRFIGFFDDEKPEGSEISKLGCCLGGLNRVNEWETPLDLVLCFGSPSTIEMVSKSIDNSNISFPNIIVPGVWISDRASIKLGQGNIILGMCELTTHISIGNFNLFNGHITLGHDISVGDFNVFMPGCRVSGEVSIGNLCVIGSMAFVKQQLDIPDGVVLSPLSALLSSPKAYSTYIGNPARRLKY